MVLGDGAKGLGDRPETLGFEGLIEANKKILQLSQLAPDTAPSFIAKDKIAFMSSDNIILCY